MATLGFSTKWPKHMGGGDTNFIPKIWKGLYDNDLMVDKFQNILVQQLHKNKPKAAKALPLQSYTVNAIPKLHTIRLDEKNLWKPCRKIHMVVFNRTKNRFQLAPVLEVKSVQFIRILWNYDEELEMKTPCLYIGKESDYSDLIPWYFPTYGGKDMEQLAKNDGFDSIKHFYQWFNKDFTGKIIHWTNLKY